MIESSRKDVIMSRAAIALGFGLSLFAGQQPPGSTPVIRSTTRLVEIDVLVSDKQGTVTSLTANDFVVTDQGKRQPVKLLETRRALGNPETPSAASRSTFSNRPTSAAESVPPTITILLLDGLNTRFEDQNRARLQAVRALGTIHLGDKDRIAIYTLGKSLRVLSDFADPQQTRTVLARYSGRLNAEMNDSEPLSWTVGDPLIDSFIEFTNGITAKAENMNRADITLTALSAIANHAASIPGRKNLIWVTGSLPVSAEGIGHFLNAADISVYPVDARGLIGLPPQWTAAAPAAFQKGRGPTGSLTPSGLGTFEDLAAATGGRAWINSNDLGMAVQNALQDSATTYALGFQPQTASLDGTYHEVRVSLRVKRPGVELRYRRGYFAAKDSDKPDAQATERLQAALWSPLEASGLALAAKFAKSDPAAPGAVKLSCTLDAHEIEFNSGGDRWTGALDVIIVQQDGASKLLDSTTGEVGLQFNRNEYEQHLAAGVTFYRDVQLQPGLVTLRILVQDRKSGLLGSLIVPATQIAARQ
jgi:VWFA-related protein